MFCKNCGKELKDNDRFCRYCGAVIKPKSQVPEADQTTDQNNAPVKAQEDNIKSSPDNAQGDQNKGKKGTAANNSLMLGIGIGIAVAAVCGLLFFVTQNKKNSGNEPAAAAQENAAAVQESVGEAAADNAGEAAPEEAAAENPVSEDAAAAAQESAESERHEVEEVDSITGDTSVGDYVLYGTYEQDNNLENGKEPLEWIVLDKYENSYLLITAEVIDEVCYNDEWDVTSWQSCSLRSWLNEEFIEEAFTEAQTSQISYTEHTDVDGNYTSDQVFILSPWELENYFSSNSDRTAGATDYAEARGVYEYSNGNCWYWAAEEGADPHYARYVNCEGAILEYGMLVFNNSFGVRPAMWVEK